MDCPESTTKLRRIPNSKDNNNCGAAPGVCCDCLSSSQLLQNPYPHQHSHPPPHSPASHLLLINDNNANHDYTSYHVEDYNVIKCCSPTTAGASPPTTQQLLPHSSSNMLGTGHRVLIASQVSSALLCSCTHWLEYSRARGERGSLLFPPSIHVHSTQLNSTTGQA